MPCRAMQDRQDMVESSDKTWCTVEGNGKPSYQGWHKKLEEMLFDSWFLINPRFPISMDKVAGFKPPHHWGLGKRLPCLICGYSVLKSWVRVDRRIPGQEDSLGEGHGNPLQYSCLENPMDRGGWWATVHRVTKKQAQLKRFNTHAQCNIYLKI